jgi:acetylornithine/LysW-gamma-L-lysine aminotransferase
MWDEAGEAYIDLSSGHGVANLGHAHPALVAAIQEQAARLITCHESFYNDQRAEFSRHLGGLVPGLNRVYFCNSGTESVEAALKFARLSTGRKEIVAAMRGFHGRTMGALSATWNKRFREPFFPLVPEFQHVPYNRFDALEKVVTDKTAGVLLEVVQGEGGVWLGTEEFLQGAQQLCNERGALLIIDEVQTGFGRTGKMFAFEHHNLQPDLVCMAKSIAGGVPMAAVLMGDRVQGLAPGLHGSTFGGNPLACAAGVATIQAIQAEGLIEYAAEKGKWLLDALGAIDSPLVRDIRGLGLMVGIELKRKVRPYLNELFERRILALPAGLTVIRLLPPLVISQEQLATTVEALSDILG